MTHTKNKMKKIFTLLTIIAFTGIMNFNLVAQDTIVQWTFPTESGLADDVSITANLDRVIETSGGTSEIQFKNGITTKAAQATGWNNGADEKKWKVEFETTGYTNIKLSSIVTSGGTDAGPRNFKVQYKVDDEWTDIENSEFQTANDWTTGALAELPISNICSDKAIVKIRWIMTSDTATDGELLLETGKSKIDNILITGDLINSDNELFPTQLTTVYPNPANDFIFIKTQSESQVSIFNINGQQVINTLANSGEKIDISKLTTGIYMLKIKDITNKSVVLQKIMVQ